jgi:hypothetical protein
MRKEINAIARATDVSMSNQHAIYQLLESLNTTLKWPEAWVAEFSPLN